jgi:hypothetical protein|tara:strand:+ start:547 stop:726 length:180 start_codon:yes stop_codon:yes gene_type:complete
MLKNLDELELEHRQLDEEIKILAEDYVDDIQITRLKKRKLLLRDKIELIKMRYLAVPPI